MATWEEYYTGTLALPIVNGPNEGLAIMYSIYIGTAIVGPDVWTQPNFLLPQLQNNQAFVLMTFVAAMGQCLVSGMHCKGVDRTYKPPNAFLCCRGCSVHGGAFA